LFNNHWPHFVNQFGTGTVKKAGRPVESLDKWTMKNFSSTASRT